MRHRVLAVLLLIAATLAITPGTACACSCAQLGPKAQVEESAAVFTGTVTAARRVEGDPLGPRPPIVYTFRADQVYKGRADAEFQVATNSDEDSCGYRFDVGTRYLVFASAGESGLFATDPGVSLHTSLCAGNRMIRSGDGPLRLTDGIPDATPLTAGLLTALGPAARPTATAVPPSPSLSPAASRGGAGSLWFYAGVVAAAAGLASAGWWLFRRRGRS
ncbi:hypothetical protein ACQPYK_00180 [Streptosporangium sp. CA-135522]|uniref:hypothetical protein n=1 Tax=Streptosporangium sp. CA-135522 TaxID=3240072 RepID=UPI003D93E909